MDILIIVSILLQLTAAVLALRLIPETRHRFSWILISLGLAGMVHRRVHTLSLVYQGQGQPDLMFELIGLVVSAVILVGIINIRPVFRQLKEANEKLANSEKRFKTVADFTYDWEYWRGTEGNFLYMSPSSLRVTGYDRSDFYADPGLLLRIIHPDDAEMVKAHMTMERKAGRVEDLDFRIIAEDGKTHWISHRCVPVVDGNGVLIGSRASNRNIDSRKRAETMLEKSRKLYRDLVEQSHSIIFELDQSGKIIFINAFGQDFFGYSQTELTGRQAFGLLLPETDSDDRNLRGLFLDAMTNSTTDTLFSEVEVIRKNGTKAWLSIATALSTDAAAHAPGQMQTGTSTDAVNDRLGLLCVGVDISARKAAEKLKEDVERIVRHDLKSPLMGIIGLPRILQNDDSLTDRHREMLRAIEEAGMQMMDLINQSLTLYRLESGTFDYHPEPVDWMEITRRVSRDLASHRHPGQEVVIRLDAASVEDDTSLVVPGEPTLLYGMIANLLKNALEASDGKDVHMDFTTGDPTVLEIRNSLAVPEELRDTFFDKYATMGKSSGTGLGTYSARLAVTAHNGTITMQTPPEGGTVIRIELPGQGGAVND